MPVTTTITGSGIKIGGSSVNIPGDLVPDRWVVFVRGGIPSLSFSVRGGPLVGLPDPYLGKTIELRLTISGTPTLFYTGDIVSVTPEPSEKLGWMRKYQSLGLRNRGDWFPHTDSNNGSDTSAYNLFADNQSSDYIASRAGRNVGQILTDVLTMQANAVAADSFGLGQYSGLPSAPALPAATVADLAALTLIPVAPVYFSGQRFLSAIESFLSSDAPNHCLWIAPDGTFRFLDLRTFTANTLTMDSSPPTIYPSGLTRDCSGSFTQVEIRGTEVAEMFSFSTLGPAGQNLSEAPFAHDGLTIAQAKLDWIPNDYYNSDLPPGQATAHASVSGAHVVTAVTVDNPGYGYTSAPLVIFSGGGGSGAAATATVSGGILSSVAVTSGGSGYTTTPTVTIGSATGSGSDSGTCTCPSTTTVTVTSSNPAMTWPSDYWDQTSTGRQGTIYLAYSIGTGVTTYAQRRIVANTALTAGGTSTLTLDRALPIMNYDSYVIRGLAKTSAAVWTTYALPSWAAPLIAKQSTYPFPYISSSGLGITLTSGPMGIVLYPSNGATGEIAYPIQTNPGAGTVYFAYPTFVAAGFQVPTEVRALIPIYTASNQAFAPSSSTYAGTAHTVENISRRLTVTIGAWRDPANQSAMDAYAADLLDSVKDTVVEGTVTLLDLNTTFLSMGQAINIAGNGYTTGWEASSIAALPVLECQVTWPIAGDLDHVMTLRCSNRRAHLSESAFLKPDRTGLGWDFGSLDPRQCDPGYPPPPERPGIGLDAPVAAPQAGLIPERGLAGPSGLAPPSPFPEAGL